MLVMHSPSSLFDALAPPPLGNSCHSFSLSLQSFRSRFNFSTSPASPTESRDLSAALRIPWCSSLTYTLTWLLTLSSPNTNMWKSYPYEPLPWVPLYPALFFVVLTLTSLIYYPLFTNTNWRFPLPDFKLFLQSLQVSKLHCTCIGTTHTACIISVNVLRRNKDHLDGNFQQTPHAQPQTAAMETSSWSFCKTSATFLWWKKCHGA